MDESLKNVLSRHDQGSWREIRLRRILKALIRLANINSTWLEDSEDDTLGSDVKRNIRVIKTKKKKDSLISIKQKATLNKWPEHRDEAEKHYLSVVLGDLRCFKRYPEESRRALAAVACFSYFPPGRYVLKENDPPLNYYYILSGEVSIRKSEPRTHGIVENETNVFIKGYTFGEYALLHDLTRQRSIYTLTHCEFLVISSEDFNAIIKETVMEHFDLIMNYFKQLPYFDDLDQSDYAEASLMGKVREYENNELILGDDVGSSHSTYFVIKGKVRIIHHLMFKIENDEKLNRKVHQLYEPYDDPNMDCFTKKFTSNHGVFEQLDIGTIREFPWKYSPPLNIDYFHLEMVKKLPKNIRSCFTKIYTVGEYGCFNLGENVRHRFAIAETRTKCVCLLISRDWLYRRQSSYVWCRLVEHFNLKIPNAQMILDAYVKKRMWQLRKRKLTKKILIRPNLVNTNTINNVPYSLRLREDLSMYDETFSAFSRVYETKSR